MDGRKSVFHAKGSIRLKGPKMENCTSLGQFFFQETLNFFIILLLLYCLFKVNLVFALHYSCRVLHEENVYVLANRHAA